MRIAVYCRELRASGGRSVGVGLLSALAQNGQRHEITAYVPDDPAYTALAGGAVRIVPAKVRGTWHHLLHHSRLRAQLRAERPDVLFMMGNWGLHGCPCPQAVYIHNPWRLYPDSPARQRLSVSKRAIAALRDRWFRSALRHCDAVVSQTPVMLARLERLFGVERSRMAIVPNATTPECKRHPTETQAAQGIKQYRHTVRALCLARYMLHKNIDTLLDVADRLLALGRTDIGIYVTVSPTHGAHAERFLTRLAHNGRDRVLHNLGEVPMDEVPSCYDSVDALLLPTLLESFSGTYVDAMSRGVPIITSDLDFARIVCGPAALYVDPLNADAIAHGLLTILGSPSMWQSKVEIGRQRCRERFPDWTEIASRVILLLERLGEGQPLDPVNNDPWFQELSAITQPTMDTR